VGHFFYILMPNKPSRSIDEQIALLKERGGMLFRDEAAAKPLLLNISYYRLKGYWWDMQSDRVVHKFYPESYFEDVIDRYYFDRQLRVILFDVIELIEIGLRTRMIYFLAQTYGGLWYLNNAISENAYLHAQHFERLKDEFDRSKEIYAKDFKDKHPDCNPDVWIILETASFGTLSKIYKNLKHQLPEKSQIANSLGLNLSTDLSGWLESLALIRNVIAHHSRIWSRNFVKFPNQIANPRGLWLQFPILPVQRKRAFLVMSSMLYLCNMIDPNNNIKKRILDLFNDNPQIPIYKLGFLNDWQNEPLWQQ